MREQSKRLEWVKLYIPFQPGIGYMRCPCGEPRMGSLYIIPPGTYDRRCNKDPMSMPFLSACGALGLKVWQSLLISPSHKAQAIHGYRLTYIWIVFSFNSIPEYDSYISNPVCLFVELLGWVNLSNLILLVWVDGLSLATEYFNKIAKDSQTCSNCHLYCVRSCPRQSLHVAYFPLKRCYLRLMNLCSVGASTRWC